MNQDIKVGDVVRDASMDVLPGFQNPPAGYGNVPFYWWVGDALTQERIGWQMDQLEACGGITGLQINYAHGYWDGGGFCGLSMPSDPPLFSEAWWELVAWAMQEAKRRGWSLSLSDYTLGPGQGWVFDKVVRESPGMRGAVLRAERLEAPVRGRVWTLPQNLLSLTAVRPDGALEDLTPLCREGTLQWEGGDAATTRVAVYVEHPRFSMNPMHPESGRRYADGFFGQFERRFPGEAGKGLNFFFSDELDFKVRGWLWSDDFAEEFQRRKGYDVLPELALLFVDGNARAPKVRLDYADVMVQLSEERFFKPVFDWHESRGMIYGCDHGGRGLDVTEFGDYFRTQRWNQGPGCDQPYGECNLIKNKVASSIAHLYLRPRVWLEGFHSTGWGFGSDRLTHATFRNFAQGQNLLSLHGLYYTTHGGFWEWAPPCNHFRMPYWKHSKVFFDMLQRISYLLAQGHHRCDVAVLYPVASVEGQLNNTDAVTAAFGLGEALYARRTDFDFMDFESLDRAEIQGDTLAVSGELYRVLVLPSMKVIRWNTLVKALAFHRAGGNVAVLGDVPESSDRVGGRDPELEKAVAELVGNGERVFRDAESLCAWIAAVSDVPDFNVEGDVTEPVDFMHRRIGARDVYFIYGVPGGTTCRFRATGAAERWDVWSGTTEPVPVLEQTATATRLRLPGAGVEAQVIVFAPGKSVTQQPDFPKTAKPEIPIEAVWTVCLAPTLDNRFGDFRLPAHQEFIGAAVLRACVCETDAGASLPDADAACWTEQAFGFSPKFQMAGPCEPCDRWRASEQTEKLFFADYPFSWRWGVEGDPGKQGFHGLKEQVGDDFLLIGEKGADRGIRTYDFEYKAAAGCVYYARTEFELPRTERVRLCTGGVMPDFIWIDAMRYDADAGVFTLEAGVHRLFLQYSNAGRGHCVVLRADSEGGGTNAQTLSMRWHRESGRIPLRVPGSGGKVRWYRFRVPSGAQSIRFEADGRPEAFADGAPVDCAEDGEKCFRVVLPPETAEVVLRMRVPGEVCGPIDVDCGAWTMSPGDWGRLPGLESYSGGMIYRAAVSLSAEERDAITALDLGAVGCSAEVRLNGRLAGVRVAPPWRVEVAGLLREGANTVEITVYNTLSNYYRRIPTAFNAEAPASGLLGPVRWEC